MHWVGLQQGAAITGLVCLGGLESVLRGSIFLAVERLVVQGVRLARGQSGWWGTSGSPRLPCVLCFSSEFLLCPLLPLPFFLAVPPQGWGATDKLFKKIFLSFPNFSRCQEGAGETLQLQRGKEEGTCSKAFPLSPVVEKRDS